MFWLKILGKLLQALEDGGTPNQLAAGFLIGMTMGLIPGWPLLNWFLLALLLILSVNIAMAIVGGLLFSAFAYLMDPMIDQLGYAALTTEGLQGLYTGLYNSPFWMLTRFNNSLVMGGLVTSLILALPMFFLVRIFVIQYRERFLEKFQNLKIVKVLKGSKLFGIYQRIQRARVI